MPTDNPRSWQTAVLPQELECLNMWPPNTHGEMEDRQILETLNALCMRYGYGRIPQLTQQIKALWMNPNSQTDFEKTKQKHLKMIEEGQKLMEEV